MFARFWEITLHLALVGLIACPPTLLYQTSVAYAEENSDAEGRDERRGALIVPTMVEGVIISRQGDRIGHFPADTVFDKSSGRQIYSHSSTSVPSADGDGTITVEAIDRVDMPASFSDIFGEGYRPGMFTDRPEDVENMYVDVYLSEDLQTFETGLQFPKKVYRLDLDSGHISQFLREHGASLATGAAGALGYFQSQSRLHERQAKMAYELERSYRQGRAVNGSYVRATEVNLAHLRAATASQSTRDWIQIGSLAASINYVEKDVQRSAALAQYEKLSRSPLVAKSFSLNQTAVENISKSIRAKLQAGNYRAAAAELEMLRYNTSRAAIPSDIENLIGEEGIYLFERFDSSIPLSPLSEMKPETAPRSENGQLIRRMANQYQAAWAESKGLENWSDEDTLQYMAGLSYLQSADHGLASGQTKGVADLLMSEALLQGSLGLITGAVNSAKEMAALFPEVAKLAKNYASAISKDPSLILKSVSDLIDALPTIQDALLSAAIESLDTLKNGSAYERGELIGRIGFELALDFATGGVGSVAKNTLRAGSSAVKISKAAQALKKATTSLQNNGMYRMLRVDLSLSIVNEALRVPTPFLLNVAKEGIKSPLRAYDAIGAYRRMLLLSEGGISKAAREEAAKVAEVSLRSKDKGARDFLNSVITSKLDPQNGARYFSDATDAARIVKSYEDISQRLSQIKGVTIEGYASRFADKKFVSPTEPELAHARHIGNIFSSGRFGLGGKEGQFAQSFGFGKTAEEALSVARKEVKSYGLNPNDMVSHTERFIFENTLDLMNLENVKILGLERLDLTQPRNLDNAYELTQIISHSARRKGFSSIYAPSAAGKDLDAALHIIK